MTEFSAPSEPIQKLSDLHDTRLAAELRSLNPDSDNQDLLEEAANRIERFHRLSRLLGLLAPGGTAPRTALEQIYAQSANPDVEETPIVLDLRHMLQQHWGEWTPALREAEGLPPADADES